MAMSLCGDCVAYSLLKIYTFRIDKYILLAVGNCGSCCRNTRWRCGCVFAARVWLCVKCKRCTKNSDAYGVEIVLACVCRMRHLTGTKFVLSVFVRFIRIVHYY
ncbi:hypothetical protein NP493_250g01042 [Ridgeia piscesae]|uniref:Uncharacterized protein n=1 Tax=Ridgeia piscesae TaxID=27915 RepID=A0AAD9NYJ6_RIDPI|nr:hypothetical protein NP493_250g01042 [Ridgeia piscesae]